MRCWRSTGDGGKKTGEILKAVISRAGAMGVKERRREGVMKELKEAT